MAYKFYLQQVTKASNGTYVLGTTKDLETDFTGLHYKSITGIENYGKPRQYVETYAESDFAHVELPNTDTLVSADPLDQTQISLTLYFFCSDTTNKTDAQQIKAIDDTYHSFVNFISGKLLIYHDTARQRYALIYRSDKIEPKTDVIKGMKYKEVEFKFANVFGRTFDSETTIKTALGITS